MIDAKDLVKWYGPTLAVDHLSFHLPAGRIIGFLGPNGAGKSTTLRILTGYMPPTSGSARISGHDVLTDSRYARAAIGYLPESTPLPPEMRVEEFLHFRGKLMSMDRRRRRQRIGETCDRCGLTRNRRRLIGQLSKGNRQRVGLAQALLHEPPVLILDEPTAGLDPNQVGEVRKLICELRGQHTILLSTHILPEVEKTADRVMIIAGGRIVADNTPDELRRQVRTGGRIVVEARGDPAAVVHAIRQAPQVARVESETRDGWCRALITPKTRDDVRAPVGEALLQRGLPVREMRYESAGLEEFFIQITAQQDRAGEASRTPVEQPEQPV